MSISSGKHENKQGCSSPLASGSPPLDRWAQPETWPQAPGGAALLQLSFPRGSAEHPLGAQKALCSRQRAPGFLRGDEDAGRGAPFSEWMWFSKMMAQR